MAAEVETHFCDAPSGFMLQPFFLIWILAVSREPHGGDHCTCIFEFEPSRVQSTPLDVCDNGDGVLHGAYVWFFGLEELHVVVIRCMNCLVLSMDV